MLIVNLQPLDLAYVLAKKTKDRFPGSDAKQALIRFGITKEGYVQAQVALLDPDDDPDDVPFPKHNLAATRTVEIT